MEYTLHQRKCSLWENILEKPARTLEASSTGIPHQTQAMIYSALDSWHSVTSQFLRATALLFQQQKWKQMQQRARRRHQSLRKLELHQISPRTEGRTNPPRSWTPKKINKKISQGKKNNFCTSRVGRWMTVSNLSLFYYYYYLPFPFSILWYAMRHCPTESL